MPKSKRRKVEPVFVAPDDKAPERKSKSERGNESSDNEVERPVGAYLQNERYVRTRRVTAVDLKNITDEEFIKIGRDRGKSESLQRSLKEHDTSNYGMCRKYRSWKLPTKCFSHSALFAARCGD